LDEPGYAWPTNRKEPLGQETIDNFIEAFKTEGYSPCRDGTFEVGYEKIAIFAENTNPTHAARSLESGAWTSKLGPREDITHPTIASIEGKEYGRAVAFLKRRNLTWKRPHPLTRFLSSISAHLKKALGKS
jgi:hypothetical protein